MWYDWVTILHFGFSGLALTCCFRYAAPEMLLCQKYLGQGTCFHILNLLALIRVLSEVDIWSLGVILYTLLTGTLPFDDDNETVQKEKIIKGEYEDPHWLSNGTVRYMFLSLSDEGF